MSDQFHDNWTRLFGGVARSTDAVGPIEIRGADLHADLLTYVMENGAAVFVQVLLNSIHTDTIPARVHFRLFADNGIFNHLLVEVVQYDINFT